MACCFTAFAQSNLDDLRKEKDEILAIIERNSALLVQAEDQKLSEIKRINLINSTIEQRNRLIANYRNQIAAYNKQIKQITFKLDSLDTALKNLKDEYAKIIYQYYVSNQEDNALMYILASETFNEGYQRLLFLKQYNAYRRRKAQQIEVNQMTFNTLRDVQQARKADLDKIVKQMSAENAQLKKELGDRNLTVERIKKTQSDLTQQVRQAEARKQELERQIAKAIEEELKKLKAKDREMARDIMKNKGNLPWPTEKFVVTSTYGEHEHPLISSIKIRNNGIDIDVLDSKEINPVSAGVVSRVIVIPGSNASVIIRHGSVITVYSNFEEVYVKKDDKVTINTNLGKLYSSGGLNSNILHFEIWEEDQKKNPLKWLKNGNLFENPSYNE